MQKIRIPKVLGLAVNCQNVHHKSCIKKPLTLRTGDTPITQWSHSELQPA